MISYLIEMLSLFFYSYFSVEILTFNFKSMQNGQYGPPLARVMPPVDEGSV